jgi:hypothetical protein
MTNDELHQRTAKLLTAAKNLNHPMLPASLKNSIAGAAVIVAELVKRELNQCQEQKTNEKP